jgi:hypothetical protein
MGKDKHRFDLPSPREWGLNPIKLRDPNRFNSLEIPFADYELMDEIGRDLKSAIFWNSVRFLFEIKNQFTNDWRICVQFPVSLETYDRFFNSRFGFRAHCYASKKKGRKFSRDLCRKLGKIIEIGTGAKVNCIKRSENNLTSCSVDRRDISKSLSHWQSKVWISEKVCSFNGLTDIKDKLFGSNCANLEVGRWSRFVIPEMERCVPSGLCAPYPQNWNHQRLDLKGAFVSQRCIYQIKSPWVMIREVHDYGFS